MQEVGPVAVAAQDGIVGVDEILGDGVDVGLDAVDQLAVDIGVDPTGAATAPIPLSMTTLPT